MEFLKRLFGGQPTPASLAAELVKIGQKPKIKDGEADELYFWRPRGKGVGPNKAWDARTRQIGQELYNLGGGSLDLMRQAHEHVVLALGRMAGHALSAHWHGIGEEEYTAGKGECWMH